MGSVSDAQLRAPRTGRVPDQKRFFQSHFQNGKRVSSEKLTLLNHSAESPKPSKGQQKLVIPKQECFAKK